MKALIWIVTIILAVIVVGEYRQAQREEHESYVMAVCSQMAYGSDYRRVAACGEAQKKYNMEYLCNGDTADSGCWVESK